MSRYENIFKTDTLTLSKGNDGYWLHDKIRGMNLAMRAKTEREAFVVALEYYQKQMSNIENSRNQLRDKVDSFLLMFNKNYDSDGNWPEDDCW